MRCSSARRRPGWRVAWRASFTDRRRVRLKNIPEPVRITGVRSDEVAPTTGRWVFQSFGRPGQTLGWKLVAAIVGIAALTAAGVVYLTTNDRGDSGTAAHPRRREGSRLFRRTPDWTCSFQRSSGRTVDYRPSRPTAVETAVCLPPAACPTAGKSPCTRTARRSGPRTTGSCASTTSSATRAGARRSRGAASLQWLHGPGKPGGRIFCYFDGDDAVAVWTHERLGQPTHRDILVTARESGATTPT